MKLEESKFSVHDIIKLFQSSGWFDSFPDLEKLELKNMRLSNLDLITSNCFKVASIQYLDISNNELKDLDSLREIRSLTFLDASNNKIQSVPWILGNFAKLEICRLQNNLFILSDGQSIPRFYGTADKSLKKEKAEWKKLHQYLREGSFGLIKSSQVHVMFAGHGQSGKTMIKRCWNTSPSSLFSKSERLNDNDRTINPTLETIVDHKLKDTSKLVWFVTDLPGQAEFYSTNSVFFNTDNTLLIMVIRMIPAAYNYQSFDNLTTANKIVEIRQQLNENDKQLIFWLDALQSKRSNHNGGISVKKHSDSKKFSSKQQDDHNLESQNNLINSNSEDLKIEDDNDEPHTDPSTSKPNKPRFIDDDSVKNCFQCFVEFSLFTR